MFGRIRLHPVVPYMERVATAPDVLPLHAPVRGADGAPLHSVAVRPGQVRRSLRCSARCLLLTQLATCAACDWCCLLPTLPVTNAARYRRCVPLVQTVVFPVHFLNRAPALWGPDGGSFRPERWLSGELAAAGVREGLPRGWSHTLTFSDGPRSCVGYRLGASLPFPPSLSLSVYERCTGGCVLTRCAGSARAVQGGPGGSSQEVRVQRCRGGDGAPRDVEHPAVPRGDGGAGAVHAA